MFEEWVFKVNFGDAELYKKHAPYMKLAYEAGMEFGIQAAISHIGEPDHDAEVLGHPDGEAPTASSKLWKRINDKTHLNKD